MTTPRHDDRVRTELGHLLSFGFLEAFARLLNWTVMILMPFFLSAAEYGLVGLIVSVEVVGGNLFLLGLDRAVLRFFGDERDRNRFLRTILTMWAGISLTSLVALAVVGFSLRPQPFGIPCVPHLLLLAGVVALLNLTTYGRALARVLQDRQLFALCRVGFLALKLIGVLALTLWLRTALGYLLGALLALILINARLVPFLVTHARGAFDRRRAGDVLRFGWPFLFHMVSGSLLAYVARFQLQIYGDTTQVGIYTLATTIGMSITMIFASLATYFEPKIYRVSSDQTRSEWWLGVYGQLALVLGALFAIVVIVGLPVVLDQFYPEDYRQVLTIVPIILAAALVRPLYLQGNFRLMTYRRTAAIATGTALAVVVNIVLNAVLIPIAGLRGAAIAFFVATLILSVFLYLISIRLGAVPWRRIRQWPVFLLTLGCSFGLLFTHERWLQIILMGLIAAFGSLAATRLWRERNDAAGTSSKIPTGERHGHRS